MRGEIDGIVYDIGVSSMQIDTPSRGFSFQLEGPLDMRMDQRDGASAYDVVNNYPEAELARVIYEYGDERKSRMIAREIIAARNIKPVETTIELVRIIQKAVGSYRDEINPATRTFQALRIEVNKELEQLKSSLQAAKSLLRLGGRMVVVSFHSGEDKIVKSLFNDWCGKKANLNKYLPEQALDRVAPQFKFLQKSVVTASEVEVMNNPRARSARLRAIEKLI
jgi:16S rRNA (cytosine1402-N4)-methyltransferase